MSDKLLPEIVPHNIEAERALIGCFLDDAITASDETGGRVKPSMFYDGLHRVVFETVESLLESGKTCHISLVVADLRDRNALEGIGGAVFVSELLQAAPPASAALVYFEKVLSVYTKRKVIESFHVAIQLAEAGTNAEEMVDSAQKSITEVGIEISGESEITIKEITQEAIAEFEEDYRNAGIIRGLETGFGDLDKITNGLQPGEMFVLAARPSVGKTALAMNIAEKVAVDRKIPVGIFSLEMTRRSLIKRMVSTRSRVSSQTVHSGKMSEYDFSRLTSAASQVSVSPIFIDDSPGLNILQVRARARKMVRKHGIKLIVVDYLQLMHAVTKNTENREREVANISNGIKAILKELNIPGLILAQINRSVEKEKRRPRLSDLRESGSIEQDADVVGLLYPTQETPSNPFIVPISLDIAKQRNGETGIINFTFFKEFTRYEQAPKETTGKK